MSKFSKKHAHCLRASKKIAEAGQMLAAAKLFYSKQAMRRNQQACLKALANNPYGI